MADGGVPLAAPQELLELLDRVGELGEKVRCESAAAKALEAAALARATMPPQSLLRAYALVRHAESVLAQQSQILSRSRSGVDRASYAAEQALCAAAYASLREALPILFARAEANTLLPGRVPADEEESRLRLTLMFLDRQNVTDDNAAALAAQAAATRTLRRGQCLGYQVYLQAACHSFRALYPTPDNPFPPRTDNHAQQDSQMLENCALNAVRWMGDCFNCLRGQGRAANGVQWQLGAVHALSCGNVLCKTVCDFLRMTQMNNHSDSFRHAVDELWHSPQLANRRLAWAEIAPSHSKLIDKHVQRSDADAARHGLATCARSGCGAKESCPKAFKTCARCHSVVYCSKDCQLAAWPSHKRDCKRIAAEREASDAGS